MNTSQTEKGYLEALADYERLVQKGRSQAVARLQGGGASMQAPQQPATGGGLRSGNYRYNPQTGELEPQ